MNEQIVEPQAHPALSWTVDRLREHIAARLAAFPIEPLPFPHVVIPDFFPDDVYDAILRFNLFRRNAGAEWLTKAESARLKSPTPYDFRKQVNFHTNDPFEAEPPERAFWTTIRDTFLDGHWFPQLIAAKYPDYFLVRFGEALLRDDFWPKLHKDLFLQRHDVDYFIGPHTDIPLRIFTCIFSFADRRGFEEYGTQLLRHKDPYVRCWGRMHHDPDGFEVVKVADYAPNNFLLFFKTRQSFHSVKRIGPDVPNQRYGMQFQCVEPTGGLFRDLSDPELMFGRRTS